jgi:hypothetical protein
VAISTSSGARLAPRAGAIELNSRKHGGNTATERDDNLNLAGSEERRASAFPLCTTGPGPPEEVQSPGNNFLAQWSGAVDTAAQADASTCAEVESLRSSRDAGPCDPANPVMHLQGRRLFICAAHGDQVRAAYVLMYRLTRLQVHRRFTCAIQGSVLSRRQVPGMRPMHVDPYTHRSARSD